MRTPYGRNCLLYLAVWWEGRLGYCMPSKDSDLSSQGLYDRSTTVRQYDIIYHSEIGTQHTMIEVMNHIKVQQEDQNILALKMMSV